MALPSKTEVVTMKFSGNGTPWVQVSPKTAVDLNTMSYSKDGTPWWGVPDGSSSPSSDIATVNGLAYANIATFNGLSMASIGTINGLA